MGKGILLRLLLSLKVNSGKLFDCETPQIDAVVPGEWDRAGSVPHFVRTLS